MEPVNVQDFAARVRAKFPGAYDNVPDQDLTQRVLTKYPEYAAALNPAGAAPSQFASSSASLLSSHEPTQFSDPQAAAAVASLPAPRNAAPRQPGEAGIGAPVRYRHDGNPLHLIQDDFNAGVSDMRDVVANSAIGHSLESTLPKVADWLNLHPSEAMSSPDYAQHGQQLLAPEYAVPRGKEYDNPVDNFARGSLKAAGAMTTGGNMAVMAATGGFGQLAQVPGFMRLVSAGFTVDMARNLYAQGGEFKKALDTKDYSKAAELAGEMFVNGYFAKQAYEHAAGGRYEVNGSATLQDGTPVTKDTPGAKYTNDVRQVAGKVATDVRNAPGVSQVVDAAGAAVNKMNPRGMLADRMNERPAGEKFTRGEVDAAAEGNGVNLDLASASDAQTASNVKKYIERSLAGSGRMASRQKSNEAQTEQWANREAAGYAPDEMSVEQLGGSVRERLKARLADLKQAASSIFDRLDDQNGDNLIDGTGTIEGAARKIVGSMKDYYSKHPDLVPRHAWEIISNLAERPEINAVDENGNVVKKPATYHTFTWSELHQLRSDLMDVYRNNPDIVKGKSEAWLQQMVDTIDGAMTDASSGLSPEARAEFRRGNQIWENLKSTYDNPQHPFYHAMRATADSSVPNILTRQGAPELIRATREAVASLGDADSLDGQLQRHFVESLLYGKNGALDLRNMNQRVSRMPQAKLEAMLGRDGARNVQLLAKVAQKVTADSNPSGTGGVNVASHGWESLLAGLLGIATGHPGMALIPAADMAGSNIGARVLTSSKVKEFLTKKPADAAGTRSR